jgi:hypothetical protein
MTPTRRNLPPLALAAFAAALVSCEVSDNVEILSGAPERDCIVTMGLCGGCDPNCIVIRDLPSRDDDVVTTGDDANGEAVVYDSGAGGVVIDGGEATGPDADGDGIGDAEDPAPTDPNGDADSDGMPDAYEVYLGRDPLVPDAAPPDDEWYYVLPMGGGAVTRDIPPDIPMSVRSADVYFLIDVTGSMGGEIDNLKDTLTTVIIPGISAAIDDVQFGVGSYRDYADETDHDSSLDWPYQNILDITDDLTAVELAIDSLWTVSGIGIGGDYPESTTAALHAIATGAGLARGDCNGPTAATCPAGYRGYPCFRPGAQPIIVFVTDDAFHNGVVDTLYPSRTPSCYTYSTSGTCGDHLCDDFTPVCPSLETVVTELNAIGARVIPIYSSAYPSSKYGHIGSWGTSYYTPLRWPTGLDTSTNYVIADGYYTALETGSVNSSGIPFVYKVRTDGSGLGAEVVNAVNSLVATMLLQVSSRWSDPDPAAPDASVLISDVDPVACSHCDSMNHATNEAVNVYPGSTVTFRVSLENTAIPAGSDPQEYDLLVEILDNGTSVLSSITVHVLVPAEHVDVVPAETGRYWQTWDSWIPCADEHGEWRELYYHALTPDDTDITFVVRTADTIEELEDAAPVTVGASSAGEVTESLSISDALEAADIPINLRYLRLEAVMHTDAPGASPVLYETRTMMYCRTSG